MTQRSNDPRCRHCGWKTAPDACILPRCLYGLGETEKKREAKEEKDERTVPGTDKPGNR